MNTERRRGEGHPGPEGRQEFSRGWSGQSAAPAAKPPVMALGTNQRQWPERLRGFVLPADGVIRQVAGLAPASRTRSFSHANPAARSVTIGNTFPGSALRPASPCLLRTRLNSCRPSGLGYVPVLGRRPGIKRTPYSPQPVVFLYSLSDGPASMMSAWVLTRMRR